MNGGCHFLHSKRMCQTLPHWHRNSFPCSCAKCRLASSKQSLRSFLIPYKDRITQPLTAKAGASLFVPFGDAHSLLSTVDLGYRLAPVGMKSLLANVGLEYSLMQLLKFRAGYAHNTYDYATVGLGLRFMHVQIDASYWAAGQNCPWRNTFRVGVGLEF